MERLGAWPVRLLWVLLPLTAGSTLARALDGNDQTIATTVAIGLWATWTLVLLATFVPLPATLTALRVAAPAALLTVVWAVADAGDVGWLDVVGLAVAALVVVVTFLPTTGDVFVDGASYGTERRMALRPPGALLLGPIELAWLAAVAGLTLGPLLLAARLWLAGGLALVVGLPLAVLGLRSLHALARRWVVFVPAGFVLHDHLALQDPVLLPRAALVHLGPARADTDATDLTQGALGLVIEAQLADPVKVARAGSEAEIIDLRRLLFTPSLPGALLAEARRRRLPVG